MIFSFTGNILSMDIGSYRIKIVEGKHTKRGIEIISFFSINTPEGVLEDGIIPDKDLLHYVLREEFIKRKMRTRNVHLTINSSKIITREIVIPKMNYDDIDKLIKYQIQDYVPINPDNYTTQFKIVDHCFVDDMEKLKILIISIPNSMVNGYYELIASLNLNLIVLEYQPSSISKLLSYNNVVNNIYPLHKFTAASVDIGYDNTKISVIDNGRILFTNIVEVGSKFIDENLILSIDYNKKHIEKIKKDIANISYPYGGEFIDNKIFDSLKRSMLNLIEKIGVVFNHYLARNNNKRINLVILSGGISSINGLDNLFTNILRIPTITMKSFDRVNFKGPIANYANAIGSIIKIT